MAFTLPQMPLAVGIYRPGNSPPAVPDVQCMGNLAYGARTSVPARADTLLTTVQGAMWLLCPWDTDIRDGSAPAGADTVEVPLGSGRLYAVSWVDDAGSGFANQHRFAELIKVAPWPVPFPAPIPIVPPILPVSVTSPPIPGPPPGIIGTSPQPALFPSVSINIDAPPGVIVMPCVAISASDVLPVVSTTALGTISPFNSFTGCTDGTNYCDGGFWTWTHPGGPDTIFITPGSTGLVMAIVMEDGSTMNTGYEATTGTGSPATGAVGMATIPTNQAVYAMVAGFGIAVTLATEPADWSLWNRMFTGELDGTIWQMNLWKIFTTGNRTLTYTWNFPPATSEWGLAMFADDAPN